MKRWYKRWWGIFLITVLSACVVFTVGVVVFVVYFYFHIKNELAILDEVSGLATVSRELVETRDDPNIGEEDAAVVIVEFSDFTCHFCQEEFFTLNEVVKKYKDDVKLIYRDFPIEETPGTAMEASLAANCAHEQGKFWAYHDQLFLNQSNLSREALLSYAKTAELNTKSFDACLRSRKYESEVQQDLLDGLAAGVSATPTFFVNGLKIEGAVTADAWDAFLKSILSRE